jgi:putative ABC transport system permease protein
VVTVDDLLSDTLAPSRFRGVLLGPFAILAVVLAAVGIYGVMAYSMSRRTSEIWIRMARGASRGQVLFAIVGRAFKLSAAGAAPGSIVSFMLTDS